MATRRRSQQTRHDKKVRQIANKLRKESWNVQADLPGYDQPDPIGTGKHIPDIRATKSGAERLIEVETGSTTAKDKKQHESFRRRAGQKARTSFTIEEA